VGPDATSRCQATRRHSSASPRACPATSGGVCTPAAIWRILFNICTASAWAGLALSPCQRVAPVAKFADFGRGKLLVAAPLPAPLARLPADDPAKRCTVFPGALAAF